MIDSSRCDFPDPAFALCWMDLRDIAGSSACPRDAGKRLRDPLCNIIGAQAR
jgi:hypothetical protein